VTFFSDLLHVDAKGRQTRVHATGVETRFECLAILKGGAAIEQFVLHHYRETARPTMEADGPQLVTFDPSDHSDYLLFLVREADGRFAPTSGQTDPDGGQSQIGQLVRHDDQGRVGPASDR